MLDNLNEEVLKAVDELFSSEDDQHSRNDDSQPLLKPGVNFRRFASKSDKGSSKSLTNDVKQSRMD